MAMEARGVVAMQVEGFVKGRVEVGVGVGQIYLEGKGPMMPVIMDPVGRAAAKEAEGMETGNSSHKDFEAWIPSPLPYLICLSQGKV